MPGPSVAADRVVSLPRLRGPFLPGLPHDPEGFIPTDLHGLVDGETDVYAAGDATTCPIKQGGVATQQADAVAEAIAARLGAPVEPRPFRPVLRGLLLTGGEPRFMRAEVSGGEDHPPAGVHPRALVAAEQDRRPLARALPRPAPRRARAGARRARGGGRGPHARQPPRADRARARRPPRGRAGRRSRAGRALAGERRRARPAPRRRGGGPGPRRARSCPRRALTRPTPLPPTRTARSCMPTSPKPVLICAVSKPLPVVGDAQGHGLAVLRQLDLTCSRPTRASSRW